MSQRLLGMARRNVEHSIRQRRQGKQRFIQIGQSEHFSPQNLEHVAISKSSEFRLDIIVANKGIEHARIRSGAKRCDIVQEPCFLALHDSARKFTTSDQPG